MRAGIRVTLQNIFGIHICSSVANTSKGSLTTQRKTGSLSSRQGGATARLASLHAYSELPKGVRPELVKSINSSQAKESQYNALSDEVRDQTVSSMFTAAGESLVGYAMAEGAAAGASGSAAAASSAGAATAGAGSAAIGAAATAGWIGAAIYGGVRVYEKFNMYLDRSHGAALTDEEIIKATNPRGSEQWLSKIPGHTALRKLDPVFLLAKGRFGSRQNQ